MSSIFIGHLDKNQKILYEKFHIIPEVISRWSSFDGINGGEFHPNPLKPGCLNRRNPLLILPCVNQNDTSSAQMHDTKDRIDALTNTYHCIIKTVLLSK